MSTSNSDRIATRQRISELLGSANCGRNACSGTPEKPKKMRKKFSDKTCKYFLPMRALPSPLAHRADCNDAHCQGGATCVGNARRARDLTNINWSESDDDDQCPNCACGTPDYEYKHFHPKLYDFMLDDYEAVKDLLIENENKFTDNVVIRCPQYAILLDHVIAVIWYFYRDWQNWENFDIPQLEWAVKFLAGIFWRGTHDTFVDVETIRGHLEELLFINYAEVEECKLSPCSEICPMACKRRPAKCEIDLPFSLKALFYRAPEFTKYLSRKPITCQSQANDDNQDDCLAKTTQIMLEQLDRLREYEIRYMETLTQDAELNQIISRITSHEDQLALVREALQLLSNKSVG